MLGAAITWVSRGLQGLGQITLLARDVGVSLVTRRICFRDLFYQMHFCGVKSQTVVLVTGAFTGMVLAAQTFFQFHKVGMDNATLAVVSVSMCSELGPVLAGLMLAGRVGSALAAELGTMRVTEQIDALRTLATHPVDYLVVPRFLAVFFSMPLLTAECIALGIGAGYLVGTGYLGIAGNYAWDNMVKYTDAEHVLMGFIKSFVFGGLIALISCHKGMSCREGAEGVGRATTEAAVYSSISILICNFFLTLLLNSLLRV